MYELELEEIRRNIQELAKKFDLKYKKELYKAKFLTSEEFTILQFLIGCPEPFYVKFGKRIQERIKNIDRFLDSRGFIKLSKKKIGGSVLDSKDIKNFQKNINNLKDYRIKNKCKKILRKIKSSITKMVVVITIPKNERQKKFLFNIVLFHEWIHILLFSNKIRSTKPKYWVLDEGLTTYLQVSFKKKRTDVSKIIRQRMKKARKDSLYRVYAKNALKFNKILKNKKKPTERKKTILDYYKKLKT